MLVLTFILYYHISYLIMNEVFIPSIEIRKLTVPKKVSNSFLKKENKHTHKTQKNQITPSYEMKSS